MRSNNKEKKNKLEKNGICDIISQAIKEDSASVLMQVLTTEQPLLYSKIINKNFFPILFEANALYCLDEIIKHLEHKKLKPLLEECLSSPKTAQRLLVIAAKSQNVELLRILNECRIIPLGKVDFNQFLAYDFKMEEDPNPKNKQGQTNMTTAITIATYYSRLDNVKYLIEECEADPNDRISQIPPLIIATNFKTNSKKGVEPKAYQLWKYFINIKNIDLDIRDKVDGKNAAVHEIETLEYNKRDARYIHFHEHLEAIKISFGLTLQSSTIIYLFQKHFPIISEWLSLGCPIFYKFSNGSTILDNTNMDPEIISLLKRYMEARYMLLLLRMRNIKSERTMPLNQMSSNAFKYMIENFVFSKN